MNDVAEAQFTQLLRSIYDHQTIYEQVTEITVNPTFFDAALKDRVYRTKDGHFRLLDLPVTISPELSEPFVVTVE